MQGHSVLSMKNVVTSFAVFITLSSCGRSEQPITCEAGHFIAGQNASVTCNFHFSVRDSEHNLYVVHYPFNASTDFSGNDVLHCFRSRQQKLKCRVKERYQFNNNITNTLTVTISEVNTDFAGKYVCQLVPPNSRSSNVCKLTVEDTHTTSLKQYDRRTNVQPQTGQTCITCSNTIAIPALSFVILVLVCMIIVFIAVIKRLVFNRKRTSTSETPTEEAGEKTTRGAGKASHLNILNSSVPMEDCEVQTLNTTENAVSKTRSNLRENNSIRAHYHASLPLLVYHQRTGSEVSSVEVQTETPMHSGRENDGKTTPNSPSFFAQLVFTLLRVDMEELPCRIL